MEVIRYIFCLFNFIFLVSGSILMGIGVWLVLDDRLLGTFIPNLKSPNDVKIYYKTPTTTSLLEGSLQEEESSLPETMIPAIGYACICFGTLIFFLSFVGYCGSLQDSICLLAGHSIFLGFLLILEIIAVTLFFIYRPTVEQSVRQQLLVLFNEKYSATIAPIYQARILSGITEEEDNLIDDNNNNQFISDGHDGSFSRKDLEDISGDEMKKTRNRFIQVSIFTQLFNATMETFQCCGVNNYTDFKRGQLPDDYRVPTSCCKYVDKNRTTLMDPNCVRGPSSTNSFYNIGCFNRVVDNVSEYAIIGGVIIALIQIIGIVFGVFGGKMLQNSGI